MMGLPQPTREQAVRRNIEARENRANYPTDARCACDGCHNCTMAWKSCEDIAEYRFNGQLRCERCTPDASETDGKVEML